MLATAELAVLAWVVPVKAIAAQTVTHAFWSVLDELLHQIPLSGALRQGTVTVHAHDDDAWAIPVLLFLALSGCYVKRTMSRVTRFMVQCIRPKI